MIQNNSYFVKMVLREDERMLFFCDNKDNKLD